MLNRSSQHDERDIVANESADGSNDAIGHRIAAARPDPVPLSRGQADAVLREALRETASLPPKSSRSLMGPGLATFAAITAVAMMAYPLLRHEGSRPDKKKSLSAPAKIAILTGRRPGLYHPAGIPEKSTGEVAGGLLSRQQVTPISNHAVGGARRVPFHSGPRRASADVLFSSQAGGRQRFHFISGRIRTVRRRYSNRPRRQRIGPGRLPGGRMLPSESGTPGLPADYLDLENRRIAIHQPESEESPGSGSSSLDVERPHLLVMVTSSTPAVQVQTTSAPANVPGYARAASLRPDGEGGLVWTQCTVSAGESGPQIVLVAVRPPTTAAPGDADAPHTDAIQ